MEAHNSKLLPNSSYLSHHVVHTTNILLYN